MYLLTTEKREKALCFSYQTTWVVWPHSCVISFSLSLSFSPSITHPLVFFLFLSSFPNTLQTYPAHSLNFSSILVLSLSFSLSLPLLQPHPLTFLSIPPPSISLSPSPSFLQLFCSPLWRVTRSEVTPAWSGPTHLGRLGGSGAM